MQEKLGEHILWHVPVLGAVHGDTIATTWLVMIVALAIFGWVGASYRSAYQTKRQVVVEGVVNYIADLATGKTLHELKGHEREAVQSVVSPDGRWFVSMSWTALGKKDVILWETATGRLVRHLTEHHPLIESLVAFSPNGRDLAVAEHKFPPMPGNRGDVSVIDIQSGKVKKSFSTLQLMSLIYHRTARRLQLER